MIEYSRNGAAAQVIPTCATDFGEVTMNWLDIAIIVVLGILTLLGLKRGLIKSLVPLVGMLLAVFLAGRLQNPLAERLSFIDSESLAKIFAFAIILIAVFLIVFVLGSLLRNVLRMALLGWVDRLGGALFGFATGWIICSIVVVLLARYVALPVDLPELPISGLSESIESKLNLEGIRQSVYTTINESGLATFQLDSFPVILGLLPEEFGVVRDFFGE